MRQSSKSKQPGTVVARQRAAAQSAGLIGSGGALTKRRYRELQEKLLEQIAEGAGLCEALEQRFAGNPAPELDLLIKVCRLLVLKFSLEAETSPAVLRLLSDLIKPVMDWARLEEKRKEREFAEQKYREQTAAQRTADEKEKREASGENALKSETLQQIERELKLF